MDIPLYFINNLIPKKINRPDNFYFWGIPEAARESYLAAIIRGAVSAR